MHEQDKATGKSGKRIVVVGAGGNIGSHLVPHLGRLPGIDRVTLIDPDVYEAKNLMSQDITPQDVKLSKVSAQARRLRRINPGLQVDAIQDAVENVPMGQLRCDIILACLDSKGARRYTNQLAWRLGVPWIDSGVAGDDLLARVNVYLPGAHAGCLECGWNEGDYELLEQIYPCQDGGKAIPGARYPTNAPSSLGALAASLEAIEAQKLLDGRASIAAVGREILLDALSHRYFLTEIRRQPECRFDHAVWTVRKFDTRPQDITIGDTLKLGSVCNGPTSLWVEGTAFVTKLSCPSCGESRKLFRLRNRFRPREITCACGRPMAAVGFDMVERLEEAALPRKVLMRSLSSVGFRSGDIFTMATPSGVTHYELGG